jgi:copper oxidase (laccase) domain-containing protein
MKTAILLQLMARGVFNCKIDDFDTITNPNYYSHYAYKHGQEDKNGRFLVGAFLNPKF